MLILVHLTEYTCSFIINRYLGYWRPFNNKIYNINATVLSRRGVLHKGSCHPEP